LDLCDGCALGDDIELKESWYTCENCDETTCGGCFYQCSCPLKPIYTDFWA
jgi:hypothetical protein